MSSVYTGLGSNVVQSTSPTETIPADGDLDNAATFTPSLKTLMDHIALLWAGVFTGTGVGAGLSGTGGATGVGVKGQGGATSGVGVTGTGGPNSYGGTFSSSGNSAGVVSTGSGTGAGVAGNGGSTGAGLVGTGGTTSGDGVQGIAIGANGRGVVGTGNGTGAGVEGIGGATTGVGGRFSGTNTRGAIQIVSQATPTAATLLAGDLYFDGTNLRFCKTAGVIGTIVI